MDWLDKVSIILIIALALLIVIMVVNKPPEDRKVIKADLKQEEKVARKSHPDQKLYEKLDFCLKAGSYEEALAELEKIRQGYPQKTSPDVYLAKIYHSKGQMEKAISLYRTSLENSPDLLTLVSSDLWDLVKKGIPKLKRETELRPNDEKVKNLLKDLYFLQRKLGQGCE